MGKDHGKMVLWPVIGNWSCGMPYEKVLLWTNGGMAHYMKGCCCGQMVVWLII